MSAARAEAHSDPEQAPNTWVFHARSLGGLAQDLPRQAVPSLTRRLCRVLFGRAGRAWQTRAGLGKDRPPLRQSPQPAGCCPRAGEPATAPGAAQASLQHGRKTAPQRRAGPPHRAGPSARLLPIGPAMHDAARRGGPPHPMGGLATQDAKRLKDLVTCTVSPAKNVRARRRHGQGPGRAAGGHAGPLPGSDGKPVWSPRVLAPFLDSTGGGHHILG
jgi:hypothetical protein